MNDLFISEKVDHRITVLRRTGKAEKALAAKAVRIIDHLASGTVRHRVEAVGSLTKSGEKRIRNCRKYDLGCGYRLITLQRGGNAYVPFLGTHDECQRWLARNSRMKHVTAGTGTWRKVSHAGKACGTGAESGPPHADRPTDDGCMAPVSDSILRRIFRGIVDAAAGRRG